MWPIFIGQNRWPYKRDKRIRKFQLRPEPLRNKINNGIPDKAFFLPAAVDKSISVDARGVFRSVSRIRRYRFSLPHTTHSLLEFSTASLTRAHSTHTLGARGRRQTERACVRASSDRLHEASVRWLQAEQSFCP